jgi:hypothetical protein
MPTNLTGNPIASTYDQLLHVDDGPTATEKIVYSGTGVATALKVGTTSASVDNIRLEGNTVSTLDANGNLILAPNGTGSVAVAKAAITGGTITGITDLALADGGTGASTAADARTNLGLGTLATQAANAVAITGGTVAATTLDGGNLRLAANTLSSTNTNGNITLAPNGTGQVRSSAPVGYATGAGGTVTQATDKSTAVTLDKVSGQITMNNDSLGAGGAVSFTLNNTFIGATDVVLANIASGATAGAYTLQVQAVAAGSCSLALRNHTGGSLSEAVVLNFVVLKGVSA